MPLVQHIKIHEAARDTAHDAPPYAKLEPSPSDINTAATLISLELSVTRETIRKIIEDISIDLDKAAMLRTLDANLSDCNGDLCGMIEQAAEKLSDDLYGGVSTRGPFYQSRPR